MDGEIPVNRITPGGTKSLARLSWCSLPWAVAVLSQQTSEIRGPPTVRDMITCRKTLPSFIASNLSLSPTPGLSAVGAESALIGVFSLATQNHLGRLCGHTHTLICLLFANVHQDLTLGMELWKEKMRTEEIWIKKRSYFRAGHVNGGHHGGEVC